MSQSNRSRPRYKWSIIRSVNGEDLESLYTGHESPETLGNLFALWTQDRGDLSSWTDATRFGTLVARYSNLSVPVIAVWLGVEPDTIETPLAPEGRAVPTEDDLAWTLEDPDGHPMRLERTIRH